MQASVIANLIAILAAVNVGLLNL